MTHRVGKAVFFARPLVNRLYIAPPSNRRAELVRQQDTEYITVTCISNIDMSDARQCKRMLAGERRLASGCGRSQSAFGPLAKVSQQLAELIAGSAFLAASEVGAAGGGTRAESYIILGPAGTGKTTTTRNIVEVVSLHELNTRSTIEQIKQSVGVLTCPCTPARSINLMVAPGRLALL